MSALKYLFAIGLLFTGASLPPSRQALFFPAPPPVVGGGGGIALTVGNSAVTSGNVTTCQVTLTGVAAGDLIVVGITIYDSEARTISSVSDGNAYSVGRAVFDFDASGYFEYQSVYYYANATSGNKTITVTANGQADQITVHAASFSGIVTSSAMRGTAVSALGSSATASSGAKTDFTVGDLVIGAFGTDTAAGSTYGSGAGWAAASGGPANGGNMTWKVADATSHTATCSVTSAPWGAVILGFDAL